VLLAVGATSVAGTEAAASLATELDVGNSVPDEPCVVDMAGTVVTTGTEGTAGLGGTTDAGDMTSVVVMAGTGDTVGTTDEDDPCEESLMAAMTGATGSQTFVGICP